MKIDLLSDVEDSLVESSVSIIEFAESSDYCNRPLYPRQRLLLKLWFLEELTGAEEDTLDYWINGGRSGSEILISPNIRERIDWLRLNGYSHFREVDFVAGRRASKGYMIGLGLARIMWDCLQLQDPGAHYGIDPTKKIMFSCVAGSEAQAKEFQYGDFVNTIEGCKAMEKYLQKSLETEFRVATSADLQRIQRMAARGSKSERSQARLLGKALAANAGTLRGSATMALCIDEMAHMITGETSASADQVYSAAEPSLDQFGQDGMIFCSSSPYSKVGRFFEQVEEAMKPFDETADPEDEDYGSPTQMTIQIPSWALFEGYEEDRRFTRALQVSPDWDLDFNDKGEPRSNFEKNQIRQARALERGKPDTYKVERRGKFAEVTDAYLNPVMVDAMYKGIPTRVDPTTGETEYRPLATDWGQGASYDRRYYCHLDPSSTTAGFGFAMGHLETIEVDGQDEEHVVLDIIKRWNPKEFKGGAIDWEIIIDEVMGYCELFRPYELTMDQFNSTAPIQTLQRKLGEKNINTMVQMIFATNEKNWNRAETFKTALYHGMVHAPHDTEDDDISVQELKFLQQINTGGKFPKVEKQDAGPVTTKDMADCIMTVTEKLIGNLIATQVRERLSNEGGIYGAKGGYGLSRPAAAQVTVPNLGDYYSNPGAGEQRFPGARVPRGGFVGRAGRGIRRGRTR